MDNSNQPIQATRENHETLKVSTSSDPHHSPKMLLIGLATFLIIIIGGGIGYFLGVNNNQQAIPETTNQIVKISPTPLPTEASAKVGVDETANWKTYRNDEYGLELKYPNNLSVSFSTNNGIVLEDINNPNNGRFIIKLVNQKFEKAIRNIPPKEVKNTQINERDAAYYFLVDHDQFNTYYKINVNANQTLEVRIISTEIGSLSLDEQSKTFDQILSTFQFLEEDTMTSTPKSEMLNYSLPQGWSTMQDKTGTFEIGYDPNKFNPIASDKRIDLSSKQCCSDFFAMIKPYDGGSRHNFIYKSMQILGYNALGAYDKTYEKNYTFNNKSGLYIYWISLSGTASVGMLDIDGTQALSLSSTGTDENLIESLISSVRFLK